MNKFRTIAAAALLALSGGFAQAQATLDTTSAATNDGVLQFTGIDWHSNGTALITGFDLTSASGIGATDTFTLTFQGFAGVINGGSPAPNLYVAPPGSASGGYELTSIAVLNETATCLDALCNSISITTNGGTWYVKFDDSPDANQAAGTGFTDGTTIISGDWTGGSAVFTDVGGFGVGGGQVFGTVTFTDNNFINPDLLATVVQTSLNFPGTAAWTPSANVNDAAVGPITDSNFIVQADADQTFTVEQVPEPATLGLAGLGLLGLALSRKRRHGATA